MLKNLKKCCKNLGVKFLVKAAGNPLFEDLTEKQLEKRLEKFIIRKAKKYGANVTIKKLEVKSDSKIFRFHLDADAEFDREGMSTFLEKIGL